MADLIRQFMEEAELVHANLYLVPRTALDAKIAELTKDVPSEKIYDARNDAPIPRDDLARKMVGISEMVTGIAETGSLIVDLTAPDHLASLLPQRHIAILDANKIYPALEDYLASGEAPLCYTMITGPSKTADIEKILVYGAHGPVALDILIYTDP
ncbi:MAG: lactate utilization protein [Lentisphaeria bacterium]|nr:lactate utilization protein [Candidatus Neomarinimicrobiota bacterium]MCF7841846.1 lactate utilization protein [Lentisphaeria bacterium]